MATKTISITEEAYDRLAVRKDEHESFTQVILRITGKVKLSDFAGVLSAATAEKLQRRVREAREISRHRAERTKRMLQR